MSSDEFLSRFYRSMDKIDEQHRAMRDEFTRLVVEPSATTPKKGDRVIVAVGLLNRGHLWMREEATVIECGDTSYKISFAERKKYGTNEPEEMWVHQAVIADVLPPIAPIPTVSAEQR